ncbi:DNA photolyase family protein [Candidatus Berkiella cookevillensis]|uniref:Deoxyribodipyrimidine photo-lyase n=1 Tax=Candidatus Berkiella cookevillensis TaxID=437022 RepID=A0A0Q9YSD9_9GAMM|nr:deoxyribodipyrimidine photo-lyase [Candidatus Berkiella cookevillensis]MCS5707282.1 DNA photolyase family protein [Candidatus Berkiella cookevillensis]
MKKALYWFRQDLRLTDNAALLHAIQENDSVTLLYIYDTDKKNAWTPGEAAKWFLYESLKSLTHDIQKRGGHLIVRKGSPQSILDEIIKKNDISSIYWNRCYDPFSIHRDTKIKATLRQNGIIVNTYNSSLLIEPSQIHNSTGGYFKVYTPFKNRILPLLENIIPNKKICKFPENSCKNQNIVEDWHHWNLWPQHSWTQKLAKYHAPSEKMAKHLLKTFINSQIEYYGEQRDFPALSSVSKLSPYLHFGQISPHQIVYAINEKTLSIQNQKSRQIYLSQIIWREFCHYLLFHFPELPHHNFKEKFNAFKWDKDSKSLKKWQTGYTGYPIVDAGMRELWETGIMHNRVRMIVASFLTKDLFLHWTEGQNWFWNTLVDADLANNAAGWQWVSGSGADAQPYFRIFNPITQSEKFDSNGTYIRRWVPELQALPDKFIHAPWKADILELKKLGITLGKDYPFPMVEHSTAREKALLLYKDLGV